MKVKTIKTNWEYIANWIDRETQLSSKDELNIGATREEIADFQKQLKIVLPDDFIQSYLLCNGFQKDLELMNGGTLLSLEKIENAYTQIVKGIWQPHLLPFVDMGDGDFIVLNLTTKTIVYRRIPIMDEIPEKLFPSFSVFLSEFVKDLKEDNGFMSELYCN